MAAEREAAALLDGRHDLQLSEAQVPPLLLSPRRPVGAEDIRDLQGGTLHAALLRCGAWLQRADHLAQDLGAHLGIERRGLEFFMSEQNLDHADIHLLLEQMRREAVSKRVHRDALVDARCKGSLVYGAVQLPRAQRLDGGQAREEPAALEHFALSPRDPPPSTPPVQQNRG